MPIHIQILNLNDGAAIRQCVNRERKKKKWWAAKGAAPMCCNICCHHIKTVTATVILVFRSAWTSYIYGLTRTTFWRFVCQQGGFSLVPSTVVTTSAPREISMIARAMAVAVMSTSASTLPPPTTLFIEFPTASAKGLVVSVVAYHIIK